MTMLRFRIIATHANALPVAPCGIKGVQDISRTEKNWNGMGPSMANQLALALLMMCFRVTLIQASVSRDFDVCLLWKYILNNNALHMI